MSFESASTSIKLRLQNANISLQKDKPDTDEDSQQSSRSTPINSVIDTSEVSAFYTTTITANFWSN